MNFGQAIEFAKQGYPIRRTGWNGKGMFVAYSPGHKDFPASCFFAPANQKFAEENGGTADVLPCFTMKTVEGKILVGWSATQTDILAEDWEIAN